MEKKLYRVPEGTMVDGKYVGANQTAMMTAKQASARGATEVQDVDSGEATKFADVAPSQATWPRTKNAIPVDDKGKVIGEESDTNTAPENVKAKAAEK